MNEREQLSFGVAILARFEPRLLRATLASVRASTLVPARIVLMMPQTREHLFAGIAGNGRAGEALRRVVVPDDSLLQAGINALVAEVDVTLLLPEGVILDPGYLAAVAEEARSFEDMVAAVDLVHHVVKIDSEAAAATEPAELNGSHRQQDPSARTTLRAFFAARSLLGAVFWVRNAVLGQIKLAAPPDLGEAIAYALALDELRTRGRTMLRFTGAASHLRLLPERRSGYDAGYQLYRWLYLVGEAQQSESALRGARPVHLRPRPERIRLMLMQGLRALASPANRHHAMTFLQGALAARRDMRNTRRKVRHDLREMR